MKIKVSEATNIQLDWMVAKCEGPNTIASCYLDDEGLPIWLEEAEHHEWEPSTNWAQGGPIIEREEITVKHVIPAMKDSIWQAHPSMSAKGAGGKWGIGPTPLIAAMRCTVSSKLGDTVEIPDELA